MNDFESQFQQNLRSIQGQTSSLFTSSQVIKLSQQQEVTKQQEAKTKQAEYEAYAKQASVVRIYSLYSFRTGKWPSFLGSLVLATFGLQNPPRSSATEELVLFAYVASDHLNHTSHSVILPQYCHVDLTVPS